MINFASHGLHHYISLSKQASVLYCSSSALRRSRFKSVKHGAKIACCDRCQSIDQNRQSFLLVDFHMYRVEKGEIPSSLCLIIRIGRRRPGLWGEMGLARCGRGGTEGDLGCC